MTITFGVLVAVLVFIAFIAFIVIAFAPCIAILRNTVTDMDARLDSCAKNCNQLERKVVDIGSYHLTAKERQGEQISHLHGRVSKLEKSPEKAAIGEAAFIPDMTSRDHNEWSLLLSDLIQQAEVCGFELNVNFSIPVED